MRLQKQLSRKVGNKLYPKWVITIPPDKVDSVGWREGQELEADVRDGKIILKKK